MRLDTETGELTHGAWHDWVLYASSMDISPNGENIIVSLGWGYGGGVARLPGLEPVHWSDSGWHGGGGVFMTDSEIAVTSNFLTEIPTIDGGFQVKRLEDNVLRARLQRDGWNRDGDRWTSMPDCVVPRIWMRELAAIPQIHHLEFAVEDKNGREHLVKFAWYDSRGQLLLARDSRVEIYAEPDGGLGSLTHCLDLGAIEHPKHATTWETFKSVWQPDNSRATEQS